MQGHKSTLTVVRSIIFHGAIDPDLMENVAIAEAFEDNDLVEVIGEYGVYMSKIISSETHRNIVSPIYLRVISVVRRLAEIECKEFKRIFEDYINFHIQDLSQACKASFYKYYSGTQTQTLDDD